MVFAGRLDDIDRAVDTAQRVRATAYGLGILLTDDASFRDIIVDQDMGAWGDAPLNRKLVFGGTYDHATLSYSTDPVGGIVCPIPTSPLTAQMIAEAWYIAPPGVTIGKVYYKAASTTLPATWAATLNTAAADAGAAAVNAAATLDGTLRLATIASPTRYAFWELYSAGSAATSATVGANTRVTSLAVYSNHGITLRDPGDGTPFGVYASDVVTYLAGQVAGIVVRSVDVSSSFVIPHLVWRDSTTRGQSIQDSSRFHDVAWGVWGPSSALDPSTSGYLDWKLRDLTSADWTAARADCDDIALTVVTNACYDKVDVTYTDTTGQPQVATRTTTRASDLTVDRKATLAGGTLTSTQAASLGDAFLAFSSQLPAKGTVSLSQPISHKTRGLLAPVYMRADGSNLKLRDVLPSKDLFSLSATADRKQLFPIERVSVDCSGPVARVSVEVDQGTDRLSAIQARLETGVGVALGQVS